MRMLGQFYTLQHWWDFCSQQWSSYGLELINCVRCVGCGGDKFQNFQISISVFPFFRIIPSHLSQYLSEYSKNQKSNPQPTTHTPQTVKLQTQTPTSNSHNYCTTVDYTAHQTPSGDTKGGDIIRRGRCQSPVAFNLLTQFRDTSRRWASGFPPFLL